MSEFKVSIEGKGKHQELVIRVPVNQPLIESKSGKSLLVASSGGNVKTDCELNGEQIVIGLNAYIPNK